MKLKSVEIENFRAIKKCSIHFKELSVSDPIKNRMGGVIYGIKKDIDNYKFCR